MRVVGGIAGGIPLVCPRTADVRPTMDRVRAAIFSSLAERVPEARVLDLFAGSGAMGIEALSRGAARAVFVERDRGTAEFIRRNLAKARLEAGAEVCVLDAAKYLARQVEGMARFDLIFADPPYTTGSQPEDFSIQILTAPGLETVLAEGGVVVLEKSPQHRMTPPPQWEVTRQKRYGTTEVLFLQRAT